MPVIEQLRYITFSSLLMSLRLSKGRTCKKLLGTAPKLRTTELHSSGRLVPDSVGDGSLTGGGAELVLRRLVISFFLPQVCGDHLR